MKKIIKKCGENRYTGWWRYVCVLPVLLLPGVWGATAYADHEMSDGHHREDHELAREALRAGQILPLGKMLHVVNSRYPDDTVLEVELKHDDDRWLYVFKMLSTQGVRRKIAVDAANGGIVGVKEKQHEDSGR